MAKKTNRKKLKPGVKEISLMLVFQALQRLSPDLASLMAYHLWFHPGRSAVRIQPEFSPAGTRADCFKLNNKLVCSWSAGSGPSVLLVHGWGSSGRQMASIGNALLQQGYRIIWFDAPAHGKSSGWQSTLYEFSEAIRTIQQRQGDLYALVAHSFGVPCSLHAVNHGLSVEKIIAIASPATVAGLIDKFCSMIRANEQTHRILSKRIASFVKEADMSHIDAIYMAQSIEQPCLVIHDKHDRMVKCDDGLKLQQNLRHSHFVQTERLGHNGILQDEKTIKLCLDFIKDSQSLQKAS